MTTCTVMFLAVAKAAPLWVPALAVLVAGALVETRGGR